MCVLWRFLEGKGRTGGRIDMENIKCQLGTLVGWTEAGDAPILSLLAPKRESYCQDPSSVPCPAHLLRSASQRDWCLLERRAHRV